MSKVSIFLKKYTLCIESLKTHGVLKSLCVCFSVPQDEKRDFAYPVCVFGSILLYLIF